MNQIHGNVLSGAPALIGVVTGVLLYPMFLDAWYYPLIGVLLPSVSMVVGVSLIGRRPRIGRLLIEVWILAPITIVAVSTLIIMGLTVAIPGWFDLPDRDEKAISGALVGAVTLYLATLWTKDIAAGQGPFWPSTQFEQALRKYWGSQPRELVPTPDTPAHQAIYSDVVQGGPSGWGYTARTKRIALICDYLSGQGRL